MCLWCKRQFVSKNNHRAFRRNLWNDYVWRRQTLTQLAQRHRKSQRWVQRQLDKVEPVIKGGNPQKIIAVADATFFRRTYGLLMVRCPRLKKNLYWKEISAETPEAYHQARSILESRGYTIEAAVVDGRRGVHAVFSDIPVQFCQFHQIAIIRRYLTSRPKLPAGVELRSITLALPILTEGAFQHMLDHWHERWSIFLKERTYALDGKHWQHTHRRIRSAYRSLRTNLPYLFTYEKHPHLRIPNTTNSLDGYFSKLKELLNVHRGQTIKRRYKMIQEILSE